MIPIRQISVKRPFDNQILGFLSSLAGLRAALVGQARRGLPVCQKNDRQDAKLSKPENSVREMMRVLGTGAVRTAWEMRGTRNGIRSAPLRQEYFRQAILRHSQDACPTNTAVSYSSPSAVEDEYVHLNYELDY